MKLVSSGFTYLVHNPIPLTYQSEHAQDPPILMAFGWASFATASSRFQYGAVNQPHPFFFITIL